MSNRWICIAAIAAVFAMGAPLRAQETPSGLGEKASQAVDDAHRKLDDVAQQVNQSDEAQRARAGILAPIYTLAERFSFPAFYWLAFAAMVTGVVSFALQLTLGKLIVLARMGFSPAEILSDALGLLVSLVGLVLTTQAAAQNSTFTSSAFAVLSAAGAGVLLGLVFYWWGQRQELEAVAGRKRARVPKSSAPTPQARG